MKKNRNMAINAGFLLVLTVLSLFGLTACSVSGPNESSTAPSITESTQTVVSETDSDAIIGELFGAQERDVQVKGSGTVTRLLADDTEADCHQQFILILGSGQTLLIAHNIDIAPRLNGLQVGDTVAFYGAYVYSDKGGTVHWTHHAPNGGHVDG